MENIRERFGILIRPTGRFETVQLGFECKEQPIESAVSKYFGAGIEYHKTADEMHIYIERQGAQDEGCIKNEAASWFANTSLFGDVIVLPRKKIGEERTVWSSPTAYRRKVWMRTQWEQEFDYRANPERYSFKNKNNAAQA